MGAFPQDQQVATSGQRLALKKLANAFQRLTVTLVGGSVTISAGIEITANSRITFGRNTPGGTLGNLSVPSGSRVVGVDGTGEIVVNSDNALDTSTVDVVIVG